MKARIIRLVIPVVEAVRRSIPPRLLPVVVQVRFWLSWAQPAVREDARRQMRFLLEKSRPEVDIEEKAKAYVRRMILRGELRWHPEFVIDQQRVVGFENLVAARHLGRGVVINYMHHSYFESLTPVLAKRGVRCLMMGFDHILGDDNPGWLRQNLALAAMGGNVAVSVSIGAEGIANLLREGNVVTIATDVPGSTPIRFAGRDLVGSFGAARVATMTGSPVVVATNEIDDDGTPLVRIHDPLDPGDFDTPRDLLERMLEIHQDVVLRWPEESDIPLSRWALADGERALESFR